jgi:hypothetical protein
MWLKMQSPLRKKVLNLVALMADWISRGLSLANSSAPLPGRLFPSPRGGGQDE